MPQPLVEGCDCHIEDGLIIFSAYYLRQRGRCCDIGCRHCPYKDRVCPCPASVPPPPEPPPR